jgi:hypothetical protein
MIYSTKNFRRSLSSASPKADVFPPIVLSARSMVYLYHSTPSLPKNISKRKTRPPTQSNAETKRKNGKKTKCSVSTKNILLPAKSSRCLAHKRIHVLITVEHKVLLDVRLRCSRCARLRPNDSPRTRGYATCAIGIGPRVLAKYVWMMAARTHQSR